MSPEILQRIDLKQAADRRVKLYILRLDLLDELGTGNKRFKLKYNIAEARAQGKSRLLSFGGAWSNHLYALAAAGYQQGFETVGIVRGEAANGLTAMLEDAKSWGMQLHFVDRSEYRRRNESGYLRGLYNRFGDCFIIPEGANNKAGISGCSEIIGLLQQQKVHYDVLACACGTGATLAGLLGAAPADKELFGLSVLKGMGQLEDGINRSLTDSSLSVTCKWSVVHDYHLGGYARVSVALKQFIRAFEDHFSIALDPVYTGKLLFGLTEMIKQGRLDGKSVVALHTGGLQGRRGFDWLSP